MNLTALKTELTTDPVSMGYLPHTEANDVANADIINNTSGSNPRTVNNDTVDTGLIRGSITFEAFDGLVTAEQAWFEWLTANGVIPVNTHTLQKLAGIPTATGAIWASGDRDVANASMAALMQYTGSRAEEIKDTLEATHIAPVDVRNARSV